MLSPNLPQYRLQRRQPARPTYIYVMRLFTFAAPYSQGGTFGHTGAFVRQTDPSSDEIVYLYRLSRIVVFAQDFGDGCAKRCGNECPIKR